jgi:hypothetical protein
LKKKYNDKEIRTSAGCAPSWLTSVAGTEFHGPEADPNLALPHVQYSSIRLCRGGREKVTDLIKHNNLTAWGEKM